MRIHMTHRINTHPDLWWKDVFFNPDFTRRLYLEGLHFKTFELLEYETLPGGSIRRVIRTEPQSDIPAVLRRMLGGKMQYVEEGEYDHSSGLWRFTLIPSRFTTQVDISGEMKVISRGNHSLDRLVNIEVKVNILGIGRVVEAFLVRLIRESYESATKFTNAWLDQA